MSEQVTTPGGEQPQAEPGNQPQAEPKKGNWLSRWFSGQSTFGKIRIIGALLIIVVAVPIALIVGSDAPSSAKVGDCMVGQTAETLKLVECTDPTAEWTVVGRLEDKLAADQTDDVCNAFPDAAISYFESQKRGGIRGLLDGEEGFILCLGEK